MSTSLDGRIAIDVGFASKSDDGSVQSVKKLTLTDTVAYTSGKVALLKGTLETGGATINWTQLSPEYRDAAGSSVSFINVSRIGFLSTRDAYCSSTGSINRIRSSGELSINHWNSLDTSISINAVFTSGTAAYTLVLYGE